MIHTPSTVTIYTPSVLVDALGEPLREEPRHTFSNGGEWHSPTIEEIAKAAHEVRCRTFRFRSFEWFATRWLRMNGWLP